MQRNTIESNYRDIEINLKHIDVMLENILKTDNKTTIEMYIIDIKNTAIDICASLDRLKYMGSKA
jgi:hypothetical protein